MIISESPLCNCQINIGQERIYVDAISEQQLTSLYESIQKHNENNKDKSSVMIWFYSKPHFPQRKQDVEAQAIQTFIPSEFEAKDFILGKLREMNK